MAEIKWIKMATGLRDNRKIKQIRKQDNGDTIALMWVFMMCLAGEINDNGLVYLTAEVPYTDEMLSEEFNIDVKIIKQGLDTFKRYGMIDIVNDFICLSSWEEWQAADKLSEIREYNRLAKQRSRAKAKEKMQNVNDKSMTSQPCQDTDIDIEEDIDKDNNILPASDEAKPSKKPVKHKYGEYNNVLLTDEELEKLKTEYPDYQERIERLSSYVASTGKSYKSHYATIRNWARKDAEKPQQVVKKNNFNNFNQRDYDYDALERQLLKR